MFTVRQHPQFFSLFRGKVEWVCIANTEVGGEGECKWEKGEEHWAAERDGNKLVSVVASSLQPPIAALPSSRPTGSLVTLDRDQPVFYDTLLPSIRNAKIVTKKVWLLNFMLFCSIFLHLRLKSFHNQTYFSVVTELPHQSACTVTYKPPILKQVVRIQSN